MPLEIRVFPVLNVGSTPDTIEVMALAPGLDPASLQLTLDRGLLTIAGERPQQGHYLRQFTLSRELDTARIDASLKDGVLKLSIPKLEEARPRRIEVRAA